MATRTRTSKTVFVSKSAHFRDLLVAADKAGTIAGSMSGLAEECKMGYAFAYGVASRFAHPDGGTYADRAASRRTTKVVTIDPDNGDVTVVTAKGQVIVHVDGTISRKAIKAIKA